MAELNNLWLFGTGYWASILISKIHLQFPGQRVNVIDKDSNLLLNFIERNSLCDKSNLLEFNERAKEGDICFIVTPPVSHFDLVNSALDLGCHCWVEKPISTKSSDARALIEKAKSKSRTLFVDNTFLFDPLISQLRSKNEELDSKLEVTSRRQGWGKVLKDYGVLWDLLPHDLAIINNVFGKIEHYELISVIFGPSEVGLDKTALVATLRFVTDENVRVLVELSCISKAKVRIIQKISSAGLETYELTKTGSTLTLDDWNTVPGNFGLQQEKTTLINNSEDNLENALACFVELLQTGGLHPSLEFAAEEVEIIENLHLDSLSKIGMKI